MFKNFVKITSFVLCLATMLAFGGCSGNETVKVDLPSSSEVPVSSEPEPVFAVNPLTGIENLDPAAVNNRPVAVMINNLYPTAQSVQTGLNQADIVYEAYAEGGVTRLLAVFKDISKITNKTFDAIVVDPPRKGCDAKTLEFLIESNPQKLVYISCDSATLARDLAFLKDSFEIVDITPVDMFPRTHHIETVVLLKAVK